MAVEPKRGCGYRKVGGLYMCGSGHTAPCDRLPFELVTCLVCGSGIKFTRGFQWLEWAKYVGMHMDSETACIDPQLCPVCYPNIQPQPYGLMWIGESFYTPAEFMSEAQKMGISRRIPAIPRKFKLGETWVLCAHMMACGTRKNDQGVEFKVPGVLYVFRPSRFEKLIWQRDAKQELLEDLVKAGITPIVIPDGDLDHDPATSLKVTEEEKAELVNTRLFSGLREKLQSMGQSMDMSEE